jgi:hypothetical protein
MAVANTVAYYNTAIIMAVKIFKVLTAYGSSSQNNNKGNCLGPVKNLFVRNFRNKLESLSQASFHSLV